MTTLTGAHLTTTGELVDITMENGRITAVVPAGEAAPDENAVDAEGGFVTAGLIDTHIHLLNTGELSTLTDFGVTFAVELGTQPDSLIEELRAAKDVTSILSAGSAASAPGAMQTAKLGFPAESTVTGPDDAERYVAWRVGNGADLIKIIIEDPHNPTAAALEPATLKAIVEAAHARGLFTVAHVVTAYSFTMGLDAGVDILTHTPLDRTLDEDTIQRMVDAKTMASPTLTMMAAAAEAFAGRPGPKLSYDNAAESVRRMHAAGVPIVAGTDANMHPGTPAQIPHGTTLHGELGLLVDAGLTPQEALAAATSRAAEVFGIEGRGVIEPGAHADLVVLERDPREDISATRAIDQVWIAGKRVR